MRSWGLIAGAALFASFPLFRAHAGDNDPQLLKALALQTVMRRTIAQVEPAVACILVSRSDAYQSLPRAIAKPLPGQLGSFDPDAVRRGVNLTDEQRTQLLRKLDLSHPSHVPQAFGSGVVVDPKGLVLTNYHVVQDATKIFVRLPGGRSAYADVHAADPRSDLAVLRLLNVEEFVPFKTVTLGDADKAERGDFVLSIANPFAAGFRDGQPSASWGILSNIRRRAGLPLKEEERIKPLHQYGTLLQTDARLHLGCSGGALVNLKGEVIGLSTSFAAIHGGETPGGFAIPVNASMRRVIDVLKRGEEVDYGFLGVGFNDQGHVPSKGVPIGYVTAGSPADLEGKLRTDDAILSINGVELHDSDELFVLLGTQLAGTKVRMQYVRNGKLPTTVEVTLAKLHVPGRKIASSLGSRPYYRGLRVDYASLLAQMPPRLQRMPSGVMISEVQPHSAADRALLKAGEVVTHVNQRAVTTPEAFYQATAAAQGPVELTLYNFSHVDPPTKVVLK